MPLFFGRDDAARQLGVSTRTLDRLIAAGQVRAARIGRRVVVSEQALDAFRRQLEEAEWGQPA